MTKHLPGKFVWFEHVSSDARKAQAFYAELVGWRVQSFPMGPGASYDMIYAGDTMIGGYARPEARSQWLSYVSVGDVDAAVVLATSHGGRLVSPPVDVPMAGRIARITDPQGAELCLMTRLQDDPLDRDSAGQGELFWNELHTSDPTKAVTFYEKVAGYTHESMPSPSGAYHVLSGSGRGRGGVTTIDDATTPYWLPYVLTDDVDGTLARVTKLGGKVTVAATDIPGIGRYGTLVDPTGARLAVMKPIPPAATHH